MDTVKDSIKINLEKCRNKIIEENNLLNFPLVIILLNIYRGENQINQIEYAIYSELKENEFYSINSCLNLNTTISIPLNNIKGINQNLVKEFLKKNINVLNPNDKFFIDLCYQYTDNYGNDVTLTDRFNKYYQNSSFYDDNCTITQYNFDKNEVYCNCKIKELSFGIKYNKENIKENKTEGLTIFDIGKCHKKTMKNLKNNFGFYFILILTFIQILVIFSYAKIGLNGIKEFLLFFMANPPKVLGKGINNDNFYEKNMDISRNKDSNNSLRNNFNESIPKNYNINISGNFRKKKNNTSYDNNKLYYHNYFKYYINDYDENMNDNNDFYNNNNKNNNNNKKIKSNLINQLNKDLDNKNYYNIDNININNDSNDYNQEDKVIQNNNLNDNQYYFNEKNTYYIPNKKNNNNLNDTDYFGPKNENQHCLPSNKNSNSQFKSNELIIQNLSNSEGNSTVINNNYKINENKVFSDLQVQNINKEKNSLKGIIYFDNIYSSERNSLSILRLNKKSKDFKKYKTYILENKKRLNLKGIKLHEDINKQFLREITNDESYLNELDYFNARKYDKRKFCQFYSQQLIHRQGIIYCFCLKSPIEPFSIKLIIFLFQFILCFVANCIFYSKRYISKKHYSEEKNDLKFLLENGWIRILLSSLFCLFIILIMEILYIPKRKIIKTIAKEKNKNLMEMNCAENFQKMKLTNIIFLIVNFILMILFLDFLSLFCYVYYNSIIDWVLGSLITWIIIQIFPFIGVLIVTCFRFIGLKYQSECCYKISICFTI